MFEVILDRPELFWFAFGLVLFLLEVVVPGFIIFFFGVGAWVTALICLLFDPGTNMQIVIFGITSILSLIALRRIIQKKFFYDKGNLSEEVEDEFTGKEGIATVDFTSDYKGKVEFRGTTWKAESTSAIKEGQTVIVMEKVNFTLIVEPKN
jgi:membrane protein implicated in regulation of membrane protease activity